MHFWTKEGVKTDPTDQLDFGHIVRRRFLLLSGGQTDFYSKREGEGCKAQWKEIVMVVVRLYVSCSLPTFGL